MQLKIHVQNLCTLESAADLIADDFYCRVVVAHFFRFLDINIYVRMQEKHFFLIALTKPLQERQGNSRILKRGTGVWCFQCPCGETTLI